MKVRAAPGGRCPGPKSSAAAPAAERPCKGPRAAVSLAAPGPPARRATAPGPGRLGPGSRGCLPRPGGSSTRFPGSSRLPALFAAAAAAALLAGCAAAAANRGLLAEKDAGTLEVLAEVPLPLAEPSGVAWRETSATLLVVSDRDAAVCEVATTGEVLRRVPVRAVGLEGVSYDPTTGITWVVQEEPRRLVGISEAGDEVHRFPIAVRRSTPAKGLEGVAAVSSRDTVYVVNESAPAVMIPVDPHGRQGPCVEIPYAPDLSGMCSAPGGDGLLLVSDVARSLYWVDFNGSLKAWWRLPVRKAEGVTTDGRDRVFVVSDSDARLYILRLPPRFPTAAP